VHNVQSIRTRFNGGRELKWRSEVCAQRAINKDYRIPSSRGIAAQPLTHITSSNTQHCMHVCTFLACFICSLRNYFSQSALPG